MCSKSATFDSTTGHLDATSRIYLIYKTATLLLFNYFYFVPSKPNLFTPVMLLYV